MARAPGGGTSKLDSEVVIPLTGQILSPETCLWTLYFRDMFQDSTIPLKKAILTANF